MRTSPRILLVSQTLATIAVSLLALSQPAYGADQPASASASAAAKLAEPAPAPPKMEKLEEGQQPGITIGQPKSERKITEKKVNGKVTEIKVKTGGSNYVLRPNEPVGSGQAGDVMSHPVRGAQWQIGEFDLGQKKSADKDSKEDGAKPPASASASASSGKK